MSQVPGSDYKIYDIISRIIPGSIVVYVMAELSYRADSTITDPATQLLTSPTVLVIYVGLGLLIGEIIQFSRNKINPVPFPLRREIYRQSRNKNFLPYHDRWQMWFWNSLSTGLSGKVVTPIARRSSLDLFDPPQTLTTKTREGFWKDFKCKFSVDDDFDNPKDVYGILISYLEPNMTSDLRRSRAVVDFMNNLIIATLFLVYATIVNSSTISEGQSISIFIVLFTTIMTIPSVAVAFSFIERHYVNRLILEYFYQRRIEEEKGQSYSNPAELNNRENTS